MRTKICTLCKKEIIPFSESGYGYICEDCTLKNAIPCCICKKNPADSRFNEYTKEDGTFKHCGNRCEECYKIKILQLEKIISEIPNELLKYDTEQSLTAIRYEREKSTPPKFYYMLKFEDKINPSSAQSSSPSTERSPEEP